MEDILCPIQSGSDRILGLMRREHAADDLLRTLRSIKTRFPDVRLETQIIVGFPTETDADLARTLEFIADARFDSVVVFPYDDKEGTAASALRGKVSREETRRRIRAAFRCLHRSHIKTYHSCP